MLLRASLAVLGAATLLVAVVWTVDIALGAGAASAYDSVRTLGFLGVVVWILGGASALAYARSGARSWVASMAGCLVLGALLFVAWTDMHDTTGCA